MSTMSLEGRLQALQRSLEAARDAEHPIVASLTGHYRDIYEQHLRGLTAGLQVSIDAIETELRIIAAGATGSAA